MGLLPADDALIDASSHSDGSIVGGAITNALVMHEPDQRLLPALDGVLYGLDQQATRARYKVGPALEKLSQRAGLIHLSDDTFYIPATRDYCSPSRGTH